MSRPMEHLTDDQLSAHLDGAQPEAERARTDAHLGGCEACRSRLAGLAALDRDLSTALTHDPGEAYFESFADRVGARIAREAAGSSEAAPSPRAPLGWWARLFATPRRLAAVGGMMAVVVAAGLTWRMMQRGPAAPVELQMNALRSELTEEPSRADDAERGLADRAPGADRAEPVAPPPAASPRADLSKSQALAEESGGAPSARNAPLPRGATSGRVQEMRTLPNGEQVPVPSEVDRLTQRDAPAPAPTSQQEAMVAMKRRLAAQPLERSKESAEVRSADPRQEKQAETETKAESGAIAPAPAGLRLGESTAKSPGFASKPLTASGTRPTFDEDVSARANEDGSEWCGVVRDAKRRAVAGATVTVIETGRSVRTDSAGHFCVPAAGTDATLSVLAVGFEPVRIGMHGGGGVQPLAVSLKAVSAVGQGLSFVREPGWRTRAVPNPGEAARWDSVATRAEDSLPGLRGTANRTAALRTLADARLRAWRAAASSTRESAARVAIERYLESLPEGAARREAIRWRDELPR